MEVAQDLKSWHSMGETLREFKVYLRGKPMSICVFIEADDDEGMSQFTIQCCSYCCLSTIPKLN